MLSKAELERLDINMLAMYCLRVGENAPDGSVLAEQAKQLKREWNMLISYVRPANPAVEAPVDRAAWSQHLRVRMVELLADCPFVSPTNRNTAPSGKSSTETLCKKKASG